jgi:RNA polymerase sigma-70 factor (ECF subfamily)
VEENPPDPIVQAGQGDREAFGRLVAMHWDRLVRLARSVVGEVEAEDAVQEGLVLAWQRIGGLRDPGRFPAWVSRIVFRRCLRRARRARSLLPLSEAPESAVEGNPAAGIDVWQILRKLAPGQRAVLHLTVVEGMTDVEIGRALGIAAASVRSHRRRAKETIERLLRGGTS